MFASTATRAPTGFFSKSCVVFVALIGVMGSTVLASPTHSQSRPASPTTAAAPDISAKETAEREVGAGPAPTADGSTTVVFPDFSKVHDEQREADASHSRKSTHTCQRNGHTYQATDVMYASCVAESETQRGLGRPSMGRNKGVSSGDNKNF